MTRWFLCTLLALGVAGAAQARTLEVGQDKEFRLPSDAVRVAHDGDRVAIYPGEYFDCAIVGPNKLVIEGIGKADSVIMTDKSCQGKAILVTIGEGITVRNLTLTRSRVPDQNGAGIRQEGKNLTVEGVRFINNQNGILSGTQGGYMIVRDSVFERNGACEGSCAHGLYVGFLDLLRVERSRFYETRHAHHIKSRAARTEVLDCTIEDGPEGTASYEIELPSGGNLLARGNTIVKGPKADNHTAAIVIGAEGIDQPTRDLVVENNTFRNEGQYDTAFVWNLSAGEVQVRHNKISGQVRPLRGDGQVIAAQ